MAKVSGGEWPLESSTHRALASPVRVRILEVLAEAGGPLDAVEVGQKLGLHRNTARAHLRILVAAGMVESFTEERREPGRPRVLYRVREEGGRGEAAAEYRLLAEALAGYLACSDLDAAGVGREAGRRMARRLLPVAGPGHAEEREGAGQALAEAFRAAGFWPELEWGEGGGRLLLRRCPFRELARTYPEVVCSVHLGLAQGFLAEVGGGLRARRLEPWAGEDYCVLYLEPALLPRATEDGGEE